MLRTNYMLKLFLTCFEHKISLFRNCICDMICNVLEIYAEVISLEKFLGGLRAPRGCTPNQSC